MKHFGDSDNKTIHKSCIQCNKCFSVTYISIGSGSANAARKKYCSIECKRKYLCENKTKNNIELQCIVCKNIFYRPRCFGIQETCSYKCKGTLYSKNLQKEYGWHNKKCENKKCDKFFIVKETWKRLKRFCNPQCFAQHINKQVEVTCIFCKKVFIGKKNRKVCNRKCQFAAQSAGLIHINTNGRTGYRKDLGNNHYFKSSFEADFARYLNYMNKMFEYEPKTFYVLSGSYERHYTPDFFVNSENQYYELKGINNINNDFAKMMNTNTIAAKILNAQNDEVNIEILYMQNFYDMLKTNNLFNEIENLEYRDYNGTKHLITKR